MNEPLLYLNENNIFRRGHESMVKTCLKEIKVIIYTNHGYFCFLWLNPMNFIIKHA